jgi:CRP-like cAMP-binding protein
MAQDGPEVAATRVVLTPEEALVAVPAAVTRRLLLRAAVRELPNRTVLAGAALPSGCGMVLAGLLRSFVAIADGREVTLSYIGPGRMIGLGPLFAPPRPPEEQRRRPSVLHLQALTRARAPWLSADTVRSLAREEPALGVFLLEQLARTNIELSRSLAGTAFGSVRQRVAGHLLQLAREQGADGTRVVPVTQQQLADAVGSARQAVTRALRELRQRGLIATSRGRIRLQESEVLAADVSVAFVV